MNALGPSGRYAFPVITPIAAPSYPTNPFVLAAGLLVPRKSGIVEVKAMVNVNVPTTDPNDTVRAFHGKRRSRSWARRGCRDGSAYPSADYDVVTEEAINALKETKLRFSGSQYQNW